MASILALSSSTGNQTKSKGLNSINEPLTEDQLHSKQIFTFKTITRLVKT